MTATNKSVLDLIRFVALTLQTWSAMIADHTNLTGHYDFEFDTAFVNISGASLAARL